MGIPSSGQNYAAQGPKFPVPEVYDRRPPEGNMQGRPDIYDAKAAYPAMHMPPAENWSENVKPESSSFVPQFVYPPQYPGANGFSSPLPLPLPLPLSPSPSFEPDHAALTTNSHTDAYPTPTSSSHTKSRALPPPSAAMVGRYPPGTQTSTTPLASSQRARPSHTGTTHMPMPVSTIPPHPSQFPPMYPSSNVTYPPTSYHSPGSSFSNPQGPSPYYSPQPQPVPILAHTQPGPTHLTQQYALPPSIPPSRWASFKQALSHLKEACCCGCSS